MLDGKRDNKSDNRLIRYLIALPNGVDVTNHNVMKVYELILISKILILPSSFASSSSFRIIYR